MGVCCFDNLQSIHVVHELLLFDAQVQKLRNQSLELEEHDHLKCFIYFFKDEPVFWLRCVEFQLLECSHLLEVGKHSFEFRFAFEGFNCQLEQMVEALLGHYCVVAFKSGQ